MPVEDARLVGIQEVGHVEDPGGTATDTPWGNTQQDGVEVQLSAENVRLQSGQAKMAENINLVTANMTLVFALVVSELTALQRLWGLPTAAFSGDLEAASPTPESLTITESNLGTREDALYILGPGPVSTRRVDARSCRVGDIGGVSFASNAFQTPQSSWEILNPSTGDPLVIEDAA